MKLHPITVDDREPAPEQQVEALKALGVPATVGRIANGDGDYRWVVEDDEWLGVFVERKTISDLVASVKDERLMRFVERTGANQVRALLVEGNQFKLGATRWTPTQLDNLLASVQLQGVLVIRSRDKKYTAKRVAQFWKWTGKGDHHSLQRPARPQASGSYLDVAERDAVRLLMCLPGFGEKKARAALRECGTIDRVMRRIGERGGFEARGIGDGMVKTAAEFMEKQW